MCLHFISRGAGAPRRRGAGGCGGGGNGGGNNLSDDAHNHNRNRAKAAAAAAARTGAPGERLVACADDRYCFGGALICVRAVAIRTICQSNRFSELIVSCAVLTFALYKGNSNNNNEPHGEPVVVVRAHGVVRATHRPRAIACAINHTRRDDCCHETAHDDCAPASAAAAAAAVADDDDEKSRAVGKVGLRYASHWSRSLNRASVEGKELVGSSSNLAYSPPSQRQEQMTRRTEEEICSVRLGPVLFCSADTNRH